MTIQIPNIGLANGQTGDNEQVLWNKVINNFNTVENAANRLVGRNATNVAEFNVANTAGTPTVAGCGIAGNAGQITMTEAQLKTFLLQMGSGVFRNTEQTALVSGYNAALLMLAADTYGILSTDQDGAVYFTSGGINLDTKAFTKINKALVRTSKNTSIDANGFLKSASPVVDLYNDHIELNDDAQKQNITFEKIGAGNYLVKGSLGFAQEGWTIEMPKDANGNVLVAVVYKQLANNDISVKTYSKRFDEETGDIVANLTRPRDIPVGRCINLRLHEIKNEVAIDEPAI